MNYIERMVSRILYGKPDYSINKGDIATSKYWSTPVRVVDVNWALRAAAVELAPGSIVVWPVGGLKKI
jgi:hypothetical protein